jgi:hypothetical protein
MVLERECKARILEEKLPFAQHDSLGGTCFAQ